MFLRFFMSSAETMLAERTSQPVILDRTHNLGDPKMDAIVQSLFNKMTVGKRSMKCFGGSGLVLWMSDGNVVDNAWCNEFFGNDYEATGHRFEERTSRNFGEGLKGNLLSR